ncbi:MULTISPECIES: Vi polysaccharide biosynthesis UDP-N-acetylglucosamine C-6 dehydrogenase TviB [unclassified Pseudoalteromonas]|jgi:UDP-N-acetyl-D-glucosamine/UDP-N-acetyl-D-galactosamine dehydrogenase|uniref:Vi polysaccharide biosynthesis UDP-N-acetylglucosamine C-6 dehydrogenase TviB n=1 Tax=unclassified Pseudoalteromonas TaxID=194690 RepID=UPI0025B55346|nr:MULTISPECIES: Vi polysaccharide biosynthesis UDP-N-acetylglucosamine C-6 dehydrogenase TviB [unclassified Pseudoalteromonas]MDN3408137.1 Vi polysaccharide biosynthesis UDP-N-acetylglucosamine C-6 dehydrogenase TviB [Pseudoalteromonas sp. APC 3894]MDN3415777.1 Vi polysaccharide biosynthesis UDP-N-acetylglucosamine C-6 dehydrogenase TviB [Pseudoalteromonas sp. APC 3227]MDN3419475.1 Vi polysaccharide biosynthesis UDP-N-acetylglucosamine C-6 dehydrogenase TviB [Pseudoalteromonas sp. APC 3895]MDN
MYISSEKIKIGVIGLGYVGLPLAVEFGKKYPVLGFDINQKRVDELSAGHDATLEVSDEELKDIKQLTFSCDKQELASCNVYIVTVPTPIDESNAPDLTPLRKASELLGEFVQKGDVIIYESTVYPGATEEVCLPIIEKVSGLVFNKDFFAGYSPERINPGDKVNTLTKIMKITSGSTPEIGEFVNELYGSIITAGTHLAGSIKVAEAAKVIENTQRDLNIAIINEFAKIFNRLGIDTEEVLNAAGTKWNFLKFKPGLVGGHCISVDPYYLTHKAQEVGYRPEVILAGRRINDGMGEYVATQLVKKLSSQKIHVDEAKVLVLGFTFKGDCPDVRNTKIIDIVNELKDFNMSVDVYDDWANPAEVEHEYGLSLVSELKENHYDGIVLAVDHSEFKEMGSDSIRKFGKQKHVLYDVKHVFGTKDSDIRL